MKEKEKARKVPTKTPLEIMQENRKRKLEK
jgi:hypothetical protein